MHDAAIAQLPLMVVQMVSGTVQQNIVCCITDYVPITMTSDLTLRRQVGPVTHINEHTHTATTRGPSVRALSRNKRGTSENWTPQLVQWSSTCSHLTHTFTLTSPLDVLQFRMNSKMQNSIEGKVLVLWWWCPGLVRTCQRTHFIVLCISDNNSRVSLLPASLIYLT